MRAPLTSGAACSAPPRLTLVGGAKAGAARTDATEALGAGGAADATPAGPEGADSPREQATAAAAAVSNVQASHARIAAKEMARLPARPQEIGQAWQNAQVTLISNIQRLQTHI